ncbi:MAG TPA: two-component regulator propeller domain-containing protein [Salinivirgaceae bacterium]|nr:two-component regulator propeller domain-containing protein [Salinivirgaceae bacterium]
MKKIATTFFIILQGIISPGQHYNVAKYSVSEGLLHAIVTDIVQDHQGYLWIATGGGVSRFDGLKFYHLTTRDGLNFPRITCLGVDVENNLWIGSSNGINVYDGDSVYLLYNVDVGISVFDFEADPNGGIWVSTEIGLSKLYFHDKQIQFEKIEYPFVNPTQSSIFVERDLSTFLLHNKAGSLYYGVQGRVFRINEKKIENIFCDTSVYVNTGTILPDGTFILGTDRGLFSIRGKSSAPFMPSIFCNYHITKVIYHNNKLWALGRLVQDPEKQMFLISLDLAKPSSPFFIGRKNGLIESPTTIYIDHENNIWTGSNAGLSVLRGETFITYTVADGLVGNIIWAIFRSKEKEFWLGTIGEGLTVWGKDGIKNYTTENGLPDNFVGKVFQDTDGTIWIGTSNAGIAKVKQKNGQHKFLTVPILPQTRKIRVDDILVDKNNTMWVASNHGLFYSYNRKEFYHKPLIDSVNDLFFIQKLLYDSLTDRIWIATRNSGLFYLINGRIERFKEIAPNEQLTTMCLDESGNVWVGSRLKGIFRISNDSVLQIDVHKGLVSNLIFILFGDSHFNLWVGTNLGIDKIDLSSVEKTKPIIRHYGSTDGLTDLETNLSGVCETEDGYIYFATNGGLLRYDPYYDFENRIPPKINLLSIKLFSNEHVWSNGLSTLRSDENQEHSISLKYNKNHITFDFIAISFKNPKGIIYNWKMDNFDRQWISGQMAQQAIYSNLPPGEYQFRIKAANSDGVWTSEITSPKIIIVPPFWETWTFRMILLALIVSIVIGSVNYRIRNLKQQQQKLEKLVELRTKELSDQLAIVDHKNHEILDSIMYARFLQETLLPSKQQFLERFSEVMIFYLPKNVVSGDFFIYRQYKHKTLIAVADCTGHGVPGAIISVASLLAIEQALQTYVNDLSPNKILGQSHENLKSFFTRGSGIIRDSMDIALCVIDHQQSAITYAGLNIPLVGIIGKTFVVIKPTPGSIGETSKKVEVQEHRLDIAKGDSFFLFTDGFADQFGGKEKKKYSMRRLYQFFEENKEEPLEKVESTLVEEFYSWIGTGEQIDDVLVLGCRI